MASFHLVTAHTGQQHITTQDFVNLLSGLTGATNEIKRFNIPSEGLVLSYSGMTANVSVGCGIAGGYFFELNEPYSVTLEPGRSGYTRKDCIFFVVYEDPQTNVQSCDFVYAAGTEVANGNTAVAPSAPTGADVAKVFSFAEITVKDNAVYQTLEKAGEYADSNTLNANGQGLSSRIGQLQQSFTDGCNVIKNALIEMGVTPLKAGENYTPEEFMAAIDDLMVIAKRPVTWHIDSSSVDVTTAAERSAGKSARQNTVEIRVGRNVRDISYRHVYDESVLGANESYIPDKTYAWDL